MVLELHVLSVQRIGENIATAAPVEVRKRRAAQKHLVGKNRERHEAAAARQKCKQSRDNTGPVRVEDVVENRDAVRRKTRVGDL